MEEGNELTDLLYQKPYVIPKNVKQRFEIFRGFGLKELRIVITFGVIGLLIGSLLFMLTSNLICILLFIPVGAVGFFLSVPDQRTGRSPLDMMKNKRAYQSKQRRYYYRYGSGRE